MLKDSVYSVVGNKCPQCHQSDVFKSNAVFNLKTFDKMNESCSCCGMKYEKEPGYFYGAICELCIGSRVVHHHIYYRFVYCKIANMAVPDFFRKHHHRNNATYLSHLTVDLA